MNPIVVILLIILALALVGGHPLGIYSGGYARPYGGGLGIIVILVFFLWWLGVL